MTNETKTDFGALLEEFLPSEKQFSSEEIIEGHIRSLKKDFVLVDVGAKSEGTISSSEFSPAEFKGLKVGDMVEVVIDRWEDDRGNIQLSKEKAQKLRIWDKVEKSFDSGDLVTGTIMSPVKGGLSVDIGVKAFLPNSQVALRPIRNVEELLGKTFDFKVIKFDRKRSNIVISRRDLLEKEREALKTATLERLQEGAVIKGLIKNITYYGVFVDLGGIDGLLHITDMSWGRVNHPSEMFRIGDEVDVKVLKFDRDSERVSLGVKQISDDPWKEAVSTYSVGKVVAGKVVSLEDYGAFVELEKGIEGLIHISEMSWTRRIKHPSKMVAIEDEIEVKILELDVDNRRISLGMKQIEPNPWEALQDKYPVGTNVSGVVRNITDFGVFIGVEEGIDGLVRITDITWERKQKHPSEYYQKGDTVEAQVLNIDSEKQRFSLGIKQLSADPWMLFKDQFTVGNKVKVEIIKVAEFGVFVKLFDTIEGLVHKSEFEDENIAYNAGDEIEVIIKSISDTERKVSLSIKALAEAVDQANLAEARAITGDVPERMGTMAAALMKAQQNKADKEGDTKKETVAPVEKEEVVAEETAPAVEEAPVEEVVDAEAEAAALAKKEKAAAVRKEKAAAKKKEKEEAEKAAAEAAPVEEEK